jgi:hypothetical protein
VSAAELLARARAAGLTLELEPDGAVAFEADRSPPPELLEELRAHRAAIAAELRIEREFRLAAERRRAREAALARDGDLALLEAERRALADLARAERALATVELDPALREEGVFAPADPVEPILELLVIGEPKVAADMLAEAARVWLDPTTWRELAELALADPARCRAALEAVLARDMAALDALLGERAPVAPAEPPRPEPPYPSGAAAPELPKLDPLAARRLARAAELFAGGYVRTLRSHWRAWAPDRTAELERAIAELRGCTDRERAERVFAAALLGDPA